jgi:hypothetical protein
MNETVATYFSYTSHSYTYMRIKFKQKIISENILNSYIQGLFIRIKFNTKPLFGSWFS